MSAMEDNRDNRSINLIDAYVGGRIRQRRRIIGMSQEKLGDKMGLTFQQIQKYENGRNRCGASRLATIASILGVPPQYFFEGMPSLDLGKAIEFQPDPDAELLERNLVAFMRSKEGFEFNTNFAKIKSRGTRELVVSMVKALAGAERTET